jgi:glycerol dehydrogenase-like iron-containing ADH family enzyme
MRSTLALLPVLILVAGCADPVADAEAERDIVRNASVTREANCGAEQKVADAMLKAHRAEDYKVQKQIADQICLNAEIHRQSGLP